jgi:hypothetical protein
MIKPLEGLEMGIQERHKEMQVSSREIKGILRSAKDIKGCVRIHKNS